MQDNIVCVVLFKYKFLQVILNACERVFYMKRIEFLQAQLKCFQKEHLASILESKNKELSRLRNECRALHVRNCQFEDELGCYQKLYTKVVALLSESNRRVAELERDLSFYGHEDDSSVSSMEPETDCKECDADAEFIQVDVDATEPTTLQRMFGMAR